VSGLPFLGDVPVLGALFRSNSYQNNETELVILVTPFVAKPVDDVASLRLPAEELTAPTDLERILFARQVGRAKSGLPARTRIPGDAGFVIQ
jgi:pilus assembly protein CpaC